MTWAGTSLETGLTQAEVTSLQQKYGPNEVPEERQNLVMLFLKKFWGLSAWLMELVIAVSLILGKPIDAFVAGALLVVNAIIGFFQEQRAQTAMNALKQRLRVQTKVLRDAAWIQISAAELVPGDLVRLRSGDFVPADVAIVEGEVSVDQSVVTGESLEVERRVNELLYSGSIVRRGEITAVVKTTGTKTSLGKTTELVQMARPKLHIENVVARIVKILFAIVGTLVSLSLILALLGSQPLAEVLPLSLILLMGAIPVALPAMFTISMAVGAKELSRKGVLVTRLSASEDAASLSVLCCDKTGTLTLNRLALAQVAPIPGVDAAEVVRLGALASHEANRDPIDLAFIEAARNRGIDLSSAEHLHFVPFSPATRRTEATVIDGGRELVIVKGAVETLKELCGSEIDQALDRASAEFSSKGYRILAIARSEDKTATPCIVGIAALADTVRPDSKLLIDELTRLGIKVMMLTGDAAPVASEVARTLGLGKVERLAKMDLRGADLSLLFQRSSALAEVFPEDKFKVVKALQAQGAVVGMTGDGVNDAPALKQAEVGIAVETATDVAKAAASVVLTTGGLSGIVDLVKNGRTVYQRVLTWIINKISRTILKTTFVTLAFFVNGRFVISSLAMVLLIFMTDFVKLTLAVDHVKESPAPETWKIHGYVVAAVVLGLMQALEALGGLAIAQEVLNIGANAGEIQTFSFLLLLFFALFSLISVRERGPFWSSVPSPILVGMLAIDGLAGILIAKLGFFTMKPISDLAIGFAFASGAVCNLLVNDPIKVKIFHRYQGEPLKRLTLETT